MWARPLARFGARRATRGFAAEGIPPAAGAPKATPGAASEAAAAEPPRVTGAKVRRDDGRTFEKQQNPWLISAAYVILAGSAGAVAYELGTP